jgi:ethanolamine ammonia-lyase small subunit
VVLQFQAELAVAHEAVAAELDDGWAKDHGFLPLQTRVADHREYLLRPDLGRRLAPASLARADRARHKGVDVQLILADGLSARACMGRAGAVSGHRCGAASPAA